MKQPPKTCRSFSGGHHHTRLERSTAHINNRFHRLHKESKQRILLLLKLFIQSLDFCSCWGGGDLRTEEADVRYPPPSFSVGSRRLVISVSSLMLSDKLFHHLLRLRPPSMVHLHDGFREGVMPHDVAKPRQLPPPDGCQERLLRTHKLRT